MVSRAEPGTWVLEFDGSCHRNGDPDAVGGYGWRVLDGTGALIASGFGPLEATADAPVTCNVAEWSGLIAGLSWLACYALRPDRLLVRGDSDYVIRVVRGEWRSKRPNLTALRDRARELADGLGCSWSAAWVPRGENEAADGLSGRGVSFAGHLGGAT
jgi:ribonuclease HI